MHLVYNMGNLSISEDGFLAIRKISPTHAVGIDNMIYDISDRDNVTLHRATLPSDNMDNIIKEMASSLSTDKSYIAIPYNSHANYLTNAQAVYTYMHMKDDKVIIKRHRDAVLDN